MNKNYFLLFLLSPFTFGQVGINTDDPQATLDIKASNPTGTSTKNEGVIIPHITRERAFSMSNPAESTLVYISEATTGNATGKTEDVDEKGHYYFNGTKWVKLKSSNLLPSSNNYINAISHDQNTNLVKLGGNLIEPTTIFTDEENTLGIIGDDINAFSVNRTTFSVDGKNNRVGIGTATPTQALDIVGKTKITDANSTAESPALDVSGKVKIADGTQGVDKILTSDENGVASWKASRAGEIIEGAFLTDKINYFVTQKINTLAELELTKGTYFIHYRVQIAYPYIFSHPFVFYNSESDSEEFTETNKDISIEGSTFFDVTDNSFGYIEHKYVLKIDVDKTIYLKFVLGTATATPVDPGGTRTTEYYYDYDYDIVIEDYTNAYYFGEDGSKIKNVNPGKLSYFKATRISD